MSTSQKREAALRTILTDLGHIQNITDKTDSISHGVRIVAATVRGRVEHGRERNDHHCGLGRRGGRLHQFIGSKGRDEFFFRSDSSDRAQIDIPACRFTFKNKSVLPKYSPHLIGGTGPLISDGSLIRIQYLYLIYKVVAMI